MKTRKALALLALCSAAVFSHAVDFPYKNVKDFKPLSAYPNVKAFEADYKAYVQECLNDTGGGTGGIPCLIGYKMWDRELNIYYKKLHSLLNAQERSKLRTAQVAWLDARDLATGVSNMLLDKEYTQPGTMYTLMRAGDADDMSTGMVKARALLLKQWYEAVAP